MAEKDDLQGEGEAGDVVPAKEDHLLEGQGFQPQQGGEAHGQDCREGGGHRKIVL